MSNDWLGNWLGNYLFPSFHFFMHLITAMLGNRVSLTFFYKQPSCPRSNFKNGLKVR